MKEIVFEDGKNIIDNGAILSISIDQTGKVVLMLRLDQNYRKLKGLCSTKLQEIPWIKEFEIKMAPKVSNINIIDIKFAFETYNNQEFLF